MGQTEIETYTAPYVKELVGICCMKQGAQLVLCDNREGWHAVGGGRQVQEGGNVCILTADSCRCMAETNTTL